MTLINCTISTPSQRKIYGIIGALIMLIVPFLLLLFNQNKQLETDQSLCPLKMLSGLPCPGCGVTKSMVYFYEGDLIKSLYYHLLGPFIIVFCVIIIAVLSMELMTKKEYFTQHFFNKKLAFNMAIILATHHFFRIIYFISSNSLNDVLRESIWK